MANRAPRALDGNVRYLRDLLESSVKGDALIAFCQTVKSDVQEGYAVYFNTNNLQFEGALAGTEIDALTGNLVTSATSYVWGVVINKINATKADILIGGVGEVDLSTSVDSVQIGKLHYLSGTAAGRMTSTRPPVGVPVMVVGQQASSGKYEIFVNTSFKDFIDSHSHVKFDLVAEPAGDHSPPAVNDPHTITNADTSKEGWLPAGNAIFNGNAPSGAVFGYNISASALANVWPPIPLQAASLEIFRESVNNPSPNPHFPVLGRVPDQLVVIDEYGIWWMTDCYDAVPWPTLLDTTNPISLSASQGLCPVDDAVDDVLLTLWYTNIKFLTSTTNVLSLQATEGSGLSVYCRGTTTEKTTGHLEIDFNLALLINGGAQAGHLVFKDYDADTKTFNRGPVVESIQSASPELEIASDVTAGEGGELYGNLVLTANLDINGGELPGRDCPARRRGGGVLRRHPGPGLRHWPRHGDAGPCHDPDAAHVTLGHADEAAVPGARPHRGDNGRGDVHTHTQDLVAAVSCAHRPGDTAHHGHGAGHDLHGDVLTTRTSTSRWRATCSTSSLGTRSCSQSAGPPATATAASSSCCARRVWS